MPVQSVIAGKNQTIAVSSLFSIPTTNQPAYLIINSLDRDNYTLGYSTAHMGTLGSAQGGQITDTDVAGDQWTAGITYTLVNGVYVNAVYGNLSQLTITTGSNVGDLTTYSMIGTDNPYAYLQANNPLEIAETTSYNPTDYQISSVAVLTQASAIAAPSQATPDSIVSAAQSYVGSVVNLDGCDTLANDISCKAGASLPLTAALEGIPGQDNGEWIVAYDGNVAVNTNWYNTVKPGEMVLFLNNGGGSAHITTVASGLGAGAMLIDNINYGTNSANDGDANDIIVAPPHADSQEFSGVDPSTVVIYELDTPTVTITGPASDTEGTSLALAPYLLASDPLAGEAITQYQAYTTDGNDRVDGTTGTVDVTTLGALSFQAGDATTATVDVRAFNGTYWSDWTALNVSVSTPPPAPVVTTPAPVTPTVPITPSTIGNPVYRFYQPSNDTHFYTTNTAEAQTLEAAGSGFNYEGIGFHAVDPTTDPAAEGVYRFYDSVTNNHFYTANLAEIQNIEAVLPSYHLEGIAFYADATQQSGDVAMTRFYDTSGPGAGQHFFTVNPAEAAGLATSRPDMVNEGTVFYVKP